jgi:hypothetical protein
MELNIKDESLIKWILIGSKTAEMTENDFIIAILNKYKLQFEAKKSKNQPSLDIKDSLINLYKTQYKERFNIASDEVVNKNLLNKIFDKITESTEDEQLTFDILYKAIVWYLYVHNSEGPNGEKYPYLLKIFLEQDWLRRQCIESSHKYSVETIKKIIAENKDPKDIVKLLKRGDYSGAFNDIDISKEWEIAQQLAVKLLISKKIPREIKEDPNIKGLFGSEIPTIDYIRKAQRLLEKVEVNA